jgi:glycosyltransferase involved in cell wall biosynthesis
MGKNNKNKNKNNKTKNKAQNSNSNNNSNQSCEGVGDVNMVRQFPPKDAKYPFVSICTPTYNRRPFISAMLKCFEHQTYPKHRMEWIIIDDGTDKIEDLVKDHYAVKYFKYDDKMTLGRKRNLMHDKSVGDILVYMDDDDYYPPERVSHAVEKLQSNPQALCAGSSEIYIYFKHIHKMYQFGPYKQSHATAGTFAFRRSLIQNRYDDEACLAEEKAFLKDYTVPFVQLDPVKTILVFSHEQNTFDKRKLLDNPNPSVTKESDKTVDTFVKEPELKEFYMNVDTLLEKYSPGDTSMKPDVLKQMLKMEEARRKHAEERASKSQQQITISNDGKTTALNIQQVADLLKQQVGQINHMKELCNKMITEQIGLKTNIKSQEETINKLQAENMKLIESLKQHDHVSAEPSADKVDTEEPSADKVDTEEPSADKVDTEEPSADKVDK